MFSPSLPFPLSIAKTFYSYVHEYAPVSAVVKFIGSLQKALSKTLSSNSGNSGNSGKEAAATEEKENNEEMANAQQGN